MLRGKERRVAVQPPSDPTIATRTVPRFMRETRIGTKKEMGPCQHDQVQPPSSPPGALRTVPCPDRERETASCPIEAAQTVPCPLAESHLERKKTAERQRRQPPLHHASPQMVFGDGFFFLRAKATPLKKTHFPVFVNSTREKEYSLQGTLSWPILGSYSCTEITPETRKEKTRKWTQNGSLTF